MELERQRNDQLLAEVAATDQPKKAKLSKRAQKKLDKALADKNISEIEKQIMVDEAAGKNTSGGTKRQKLDSFKDKNTYIGGERPQKG